MKQKSSSNNSLTKLALGIFAQFIINILVLISGLGHLTSELTGSSFSIFAWNLINLFGSVCLVWIILIRPLLHTAEKIDYKSEIIDLTRKFPADQKDPVGRIGRGINILNARLQQTIWDIINANRASLGVADALKESSAATLTSITTVSKQLDNIRTNENDLKNEINTAENRLETINSEITAISQQISDQAAAVTESSAAVEQLVSSIQSITGVVQKQNAQHKEVSSMSKTSSNALSDFLKSLQEIGASLGGIKELIKVIEDIASQSSLLAMNAAIQAAHAGEAGKGFAVVADEMRKMSDKTSNNSRSIAGKLGAIASGVETTLSKVNESWESFQSMYALLDEYMNGISQVGNALTEMNSGTTEILEALSSLNTINSRVSESSNEIVSTIEPFSKSMQSLYAMSADNAQAVEKSAIEMKVMEKGALELTVLGTSNEQTLVSLKNRLDKIGISDVSKLTAKDGQALLYWDPVQKVIPKRPENPGDFAKDDSRHWWDNEYAGWNVQRKPQITSKADGAKGKRIAYLFASFLENSDFVTALLRGAQKLADFHGIILEPSYANFDAQRQEQQIQRAVQSKADLIIYQPVDAKKAQPIIEKLYSLGIPVVVSLQSVENESFPFILSYTGPDDWGQTRKLAQAFADIMGKIGGYGILQHVPGSGTDFGRTWGALCELKTYAPDMKFLTMGYPDFKEDKAEEMVEKWIETYGNELKGIIAADDNDLMKGVVTALEKTHRTDIILAAAGNSKTGMDFVRSGKVHVITYQSAESAGALPVDVAVNWFNGIESQPVTNLPIRLITQENVGSFYPPQF